MFQAIEDEITKIQAVLRMEVLGAVRENGRLLEYAKKFKGDKEVSCARGPALMSLRWQEDGFGEVRAFTRKLLSCCFSIQK